MACEKEEHLVNKNNEQLPQNPKDMVQNKFIFQWDTLIDDSNFTSHICRSNIS